MKKYVLVYKKIIAIISVLLIVACALPVVVSSGYSVLSADDFSHGMQIGVFNVSLYEYLKASFVFVKYIYMTWQGTYSAMLMQALLSPVNNGGMSQLSIVMLCNSSLFFVSLIFMISTVAYKINHENLYIKLFILASICFMITGYQSYTEIFYWFSGAVSYTFPLSFLMISLSTFLLYNRSRKESYYVISLVSGIIAMGRLSEN